jgi:glycosyltransferase involved in cell wall biosynthesis
MDKKMRVCFISSGATDLVCGRGDKRIGGSERQQFVLALELKRSGIDTCFIVGQRENPLPIETSVGTAIPLTFPASGAKGAWFRKVAALIKAMQKADADIYYIRGDDNGVLLPCVIWCRRNERIMVFATARESNVKPCRLLPWTKPYAYHLMYRIGLRFSHHVLVQHLEQQKLLQQHFGVRSTIVPNGISISDADLKPDHDPKEVRHSIIFLGRLHEIKQPDLFVELADMLPQYRFILCGMLYAEDAQAKYAGAVLQRARQVPNLEIMGLVPPDDVWLYLKKAALLVNTSKTEGFPNAFLEAWAWGVPVVSLHVDPGGVMEANGLGIPCRTLAEAHHRIKCLMAHPELRSDLAAAGRRYVETNHDIKDIAAQFVKMISCSF